MKLDIEDIPNIKTICNTINGCRIAYKDGRLHYSSTQVPMAEWIEYCREIENYAKAQGLFTHGCKIN